MTTKQDALVAAVTNFSTLIEKLKSAPDGSRELDIELTRAYCPKLERRGASYYVDDIRIEIQSHSTSLDAALPGENIISTGHLVSGIWEATHSKNGVISYARAHTEALARRCAALRAMEGKDG